MSQTGWLSILLLAALALAFPFLAQAAESPHPGCQLRPGSIGYMGTSSAYEQQNGNGQMRLTRVAPGAPAAAAGLREHDVVIAIDDRPLPPDRFDFAHAARAQRPGDVLRHTVRRGDESLMIAVTLGEPPVGWEESYLRNLEHQEIQLRGEGQERLARLSANGPIELTFLRDQDCRFDASTAGSSIPRPLTLAAGLRIVPLLEQLRRDDSLTVEVRVSGNTIRIDPARFPSYLSKKDMAKAIQETVRRDEAHFQ